MCTHVATLARAHTQFTYTIAGAILAYMQRADSSKQKRFSAGSTNAQQRTNLRRSSIVKTEQELARRAAGPVDVGMTICITDVESSKAITYKSDGSRFAGSKHTVKMVAVRRYFLYDHPGNYT